MTQVVYVTVVSLLVPTLLCLIGFRPRTLKKTRRLLHSACTSIRHQSRDKVSRPVRPKVQRYLDRQVGCFRLLGRPAFRLRKSSSRPG